MLYLVEKSNLEYLHHLIPKVIDDLHRNPPELRFLEWSRCVAVEDWSSCCWRNLL